jgi:hypothetical protein
MLRSWFEFYFLILFRSLHKWTLMLNLCSLSPDIVPCNNIACGYFYKCLTLSGILCSINVLISKSDLKYPNALFVCVFNSFSQFWQDHQMSQKIWFTSCSKFQFKLDESILALCIPPAGGIVLSGGKYQLFRFWPPLRCHQSQAAQGR